jgi:hypothetical protein
MAAHFSKAALSGVEPEQPTEVIVEVIPFPVGQIPVQPLINRVVEQIVSVAIVSEFDGRFLVGDRSPRR